MRLISVATVFFFFAVQTQPIPVGTVIPVMLRSGLNAEKDKAGKRLTGRVMQEISLPDGEKLKEGSTIRGHVVSVDKQGPSGSVITLQFDAIEDSKNTISITASLLAAASMAEVAAAQTPIDSASNIEPTSQWVTRQVGGDIVNRGRGKVATAKGAIVGKWLQGSGVVIKLTPNPEAGCPIGPGYDRDQAAWIFSSSACGLYGLNNMKIQNSGSTQSIGVIALASTKKVDVRSGSGWLLMVVAAAPQTEPEKQ